MEGFEESLTHRNLNSHLNLFNSRGNNLVHLLHLSHRLVILYVGRDLVLVSGHNLPICSPVEQSLYFAGSVLLCPHGN